MEILVAILIIALIAAIAFAVMQRRPGGARGLGGPRRSPVRPPRERVSRRDPMAAAVADHAEATDPQDVVAAEQRMRAEARHIADGLNAESQRTEHQRAHDQVSRREPLADDPRVGGDAAAGAAYADSEPYSDPAYRVPPPDAQRDPADDPRAHPYDDPATDPRYDDKRYKDRLAGDYADPRHDDPGR